MRLCFLLTMFFFFSLKADPWGKDSDLVHCSKTLTTQDYNSSLLTRWAIQAIRFHQNVISPADGPRSHYIPSSSQYALNAMKKYGFFRGFIMGCDRLMRENDEEWVYRKTITDTGCEMKWDPVP